MEEKKLDINSIIGFVLIFGILAYMLWQNQPTPEELEAQEKAKQEQAAKLDAQDKALRLYRSRELERKINEQEIAISKIKLEEELKRKDQQLAEYRKKIAEYEDQISRLQSASARESQELKYKYQGNTSLAPKKKNKKIDLRHKEKYYYSY